MTRICCCLGGGAILGAAIFAAALVGLCWFGSDTLEGVLG